MTRTLRLRSNPTRAEALTQMLRRGWITTGHMRARLAIPSSAIMPVLHKLRKSGKLEQRRSEDGCLEYRLKCDELKCEE